MINKERARQKDSKAGQKENNDRLTNRKTETRIDSNKERKSVSKRYIISLMYEDGN